MILYPAIALSLFFLFRARPRLAGTTLEPVWSWSVIAVVLIAAVEVWLAILSTNDRIPVSPRIPWALPMRYTVALLALCPTIALLGAKRPQDRAWQWVVLSFWAIMLVPAARVLLLYSDSRVSPHAAQGILLLVVVAMGAVNWIATRFAIPAVIAAAAQLLLVVPYTPLSNIIPNVGPQFALAAAAAALLVCWLLEFQRPPRDSADRIWLDFRDQFGLFWSARVMARLNAASRSHGWPIQVTWRGIHFGAADEHARQAFERSLRMLLRRFVSTDRLSERTAKP